MKTRLILAAAIAAFSTPLAWAEGDDCGDGLCEVGGGSAAGGGGHTEYYDEGPGAVEEFTSGGGAGDMESGVRSTDFEGDYEDSFRGTHKGSDHLSGVYLIDGQIYEAGKLQ